MAALLGAGIYVAIQSGVFLPVEPVVPAVTLQEPVLINTVSYVCSENNTINASLYTDPNTPVAKPGEQPIPDGFAKVSLSDGRNFTLPQTLSADGVRYATADESFVFWGKGNGALVLESGELKSYTGCVLVSDADTGANLPSVYVSAGGTFSVRLPSMASGTVDGFHINESFTNQQSPEKIISGVQFTIPASLATGTNLSADSYLSIENIPDAESCSADIFFDGTHATTTLTDAGTLYSYATTSGAGAGNRYDETVYALPGTNPCMAVRYVIHSTVLGNYPEGTVTEFDEASLVTLFDQIRQTLIVNQ